MLQEDHPGTRGSPVDFRVHGAHEMFRAATSAKRGIEVAALGQSGVDVHHGEPSRELRFSGHTSDDAGTRPFVVVALRVEWIHAHCDFSVSPGDAHPDYR
jgi:hypothetical protein